METKKLPTLKKEALVIAELKDCTGNTLTESQLKDLLEEAEVSVYFKDIETSEYIELVNYDKLVKFLNNEYDEDYY